MMTKFALFTTLLLTATRLQAALLTTTTAVHTQADEGAPVVSYIKAGTNASAAAKASAPSGWMAVEVNTPFEAYVANRDINKSLDPQIGAAFRAQAKPEAPVLSKMELGDKVEITGLRGKWTQVKVTKNLIGYIKASAVSAAAPIPAPLPTAAASKPEPVGPVHAPLAGPEPRRTPAPAPSPVVDHSPISPAPVAPAAWGNAPTGAPVPVSMGDGGSAALPRSYAGKFVSSRRPFAPKRPYDFQINDEAGIRFAYLDLSKLMLTDSLDKYLDRPVSVYGTARNMPGTKDIVIDVENMQLR